MANKWEERIVIPGLTGRGEDHLRRLVAYGVRVVFSQGENQRRLAVPLFFAQTHRGFPRFCPELYCTGSLRQEAADGNRLRHYGRGLALSCHLGHRFTCFRFPPFLILGKLELYLAKLGDGKWHRVITFPHSEGDMEDNRKLLRHLWRAAFAEALCCFHPDERGELLALIGRRQRGREELGLAEYSAIRQHTTTCLDACNEPASPTQNYSSALEFSCARGHQFLVAKAREAFYASRLVFSFCRAWETVA